MGLKKTDQKKIVFDKSYFKRSTETHTSLEKFFGKHNDTQYIILSDFELFLNKALSSIISDETKANTGDALMTKLYKQMLDKIGSADNVLGMVNTMEHAKRPRPKDVDERWKGVTPFKTKKKKFFTDNLIPNQSEFARIKSTGSMRKQLNEYTALKMFGYTKDLYEKYPNKFIITDNIVEPGFEKYQSLFQYKGKSTFEKASLQKEGEMALIYWMYVLSDKAKLVERSMGYTDILKYDRKKIGFILDTIDGDIIPMGLLQPQLLDHDIWIISTKNKFIHINKLHDMIKDRYESSTLCNMGNNTMLFFCLTFICVGNDFTKDWCKGIGFQKIFEAMFNYVESATRDSHVNLLKVERNVLELDNQKTKLDYISSSERDFILFTKYIYVFDNETKFGKLTEKEKKSKRLKSIEPKGLSFPTLSSLNTKYEGLFTEGELKDEEIALENTKRRLENNPKLKKNPKPIPTHDEILVHLANALWITRYWTNSVKLKDPSKVSMKPDFRENDKLMYGYIIDPVTNRVKQAKNIYYSKNFK